MLSDTRERLIDLGITDGNVNAEKDYVLNVDGLTEANFVSVGFGGKTLVSNGLTIKTSEFGKTYGKGELEIKYVYNNDILTHVLPVTFATKVLYNVSDIRSFLTYADAYNGALNDGIFDGYFALGGDIDFNGVYEPSMLLNSSEIGNKTLGFRGVFDGQGHTINGMRVISEYTADRSDVRFRRTGFISVLNKDGVIKNTAFTNAQVKFCSYLASWGEGTIENVYVGYTGDTNDSWNSTVNTVRDGVPAVSIHNCVIVYDKAWAKGNILGKVNASANAYKNVYIAGEASTNLVEYWNDETNSSKVYSTPLRFDNFKRYASVGELLCEHKNEINGWKYFSASGSGISFGSKGKLLDAAEISGDFSGNTLISSDGTASDYVIIYEDGNGEALKAASFIAEHIARASGSVTYAELTGGRFSETASGGIRLAMMTELPETWNENSAYIVIGKSEIAGAPEATSGRYVVRTIGNTAFISADKSEEYITAAIAFLEKAIGYCALSDDTVSYEYKRGTALTMPEIDIDYDSAFNLRNSTNAHHVWKNEQLGLNGRDRFPIGPADDDGKMHPFHNSLYWLKYSENQAAHSAWFRDNGSDICYAAGGLQNSSNAEYVAMVAEAAKNIRILLNENPGVTDVTFSLSDGDLNGCQCTVCKQNHTNAAVKFLNDVVEKIQTEDGDSNRKFTIYLLAYYYLIDAPTIEMNEHLGVIYAPVRKGYEAEPIYSSKNESVRTQIAAWTAKTKNIGFWFYGTLYHDYLIYTDTVRSLLTWFEYSARTVKAAGAEPAWIYVNGQTRQRGVSAFEAFKQYAFSKAQVEILEKVNRTDNAEAYYKQLDDYVAGLESEFFGFSINGETKTFRDGGYYGAAKANEAMYKMYLQMKADYAKIKEDNDGTTYEYLDTLCYSSGKKQANRLCDYLASVDSNDAYWKNYTAATIKGYMSYIETAQNAIESYAGELKIVYKQHILLESLTPRFMMCVAGGSSNSGYGFINGYNGTPISDLRKNLKSDFNSLGIDYYGEHYLLSDLYKKWDV